ncbi:MAG: NADH-quinone oxidoreductase subunit C [Propionibacteriaceae bacterium]|jgi:NADH-quinone oxidoreductase subunit C|nr:NADH-quinone oxidoreductase subunit C [Propionibacteriaceae bacterium]
MTQPADQAVARPTPAAPTVVRQGMWGPGPGAVSGYGGLRQPVIRHRLSPRPLGGWFDEVADRLIALVPELGEDVFEVDRGELTVAVPGRLLAQLARHCRDDAWLRFENCVSVSGVHFPDEPGAEFHVVYHLLSITHNRRLRLEATCPESDPHLPSLVATYPMADWHERETWDMFGVVFDGHPHLTRILMPDDWVGHPQRKDYPLGGVPIEFKGAEVPPPDQRRSN